MSWRDLLQTDQTLTLPWVGGGLVHQGDRTWEIVGRRPPEHGWYEFTVSAGRKARLKGQSAPVELPVSTRGFASGDRFIEANAFPDPGGDFIAQAQPLHLYEGGMPIEYVAVHRDKEGQLLYVRSEWPLGPELDVLAAYHDRKESVTDIKGVTPALDLAFRFLTAERERREAYARELARQRAEEERLRTEAERRRAEEERRREAVRRFETAEGRRELARIDFHTAATAALAVSGAEFLDCRASGRGNTEMVVQYRFRHRRLECVCERETMRIVDAGICLQDHRTGRKGDTLLTLESLPSVVREAMDSGRLVVWRRAPGDRDYDPDDDSDDGYGDEDD